ncbi:MAG: ABC transporter ATP-binding protein [Infirmifilum sp.]|uniref:ABC transporter ATP-binding protein n=1 Tax=Infirmifilum uzonense TaxID=1550241 RepID=A0A0F7FHR0_9CREN|nr:ABC transporter ATP-binding protein [Infirmifilum uzonense]AKG38263.1 ABC transporter ATP-binding protein [Infirmifilum uzonense]
MSEYALELRDIRKVYKTATEEIEVLKGITLKIREGELATIMGPSGSGKSTLLSIAGGLDKPTSGRVIVGGVDITDMNEEELTRVRARKIGFVFQSFNLIRNYTALENVMLPLLFTGIFNVKEAKEIAIRALEVVGLKNHANKFPNQLSGGQQQRVAIARALAPNPDIILMDEPTGSLDVDTAARVLSLVKWLNDAFGQTIIIVTHNPEIAELSTRTYYIRAGAIYEEPPKRTLTEIVKEIKSSGSSGDIKKIQLEMLKLKLEALERALKEDRIDPTLIEAEVNSLEHRINRLEKAL